MASQDFSGVFGDGSPASAIIPQLHPSDEEGNKQENDDTASYRIPLESFCFETYEEHAQLLQLFDHLRKRKFYEYIDPPQLVVVGDQSSGKSSVLEALTQIPFPCSSATGTRFATQITLRRSTEVKTVVEIIPDSLHTPGENQRLAGFKLMPKAPLSFDIIFERATNAIFPSASHVASSQRTY
jgi:hypothetical protein